MKFGHVVDYNVTKNSRNYGIFKKKNVKPELRMTDYTILPNFIQIKAFFGILLGGDAPPQLTEGISDPR